MMATFDSDFRWIKTTVANVKRYKGEKVVRGDEKKFLTLRLQVSQIKAFLGTDYGKGKKGSKRGKSRNTLPTLGKSAKKLGYRTERVDNTSIEAIRGTPLDEPHVLQAVRSAFKGEYVSNTREKVLLWAVWREWRRTGGVASFQEFGKKLATTRWVDLVGEDLWVNYGKKWGLSLDDVEYKTYAGGWVWVRKV